MNGKAMNVLIAGAVVVALLCLAVSAVAPRSSTISGVGNSGNRFYAHPTRDQLAELLVSTGAARQLSPDDLAPIYAAIEAKAAAGDLDAALVVLQVAAQQSRSR